MGIKSSQVVEETERNSKQHVDDSQDNRHLHLKRVQECQLVGGNVPYLGDKMVKDSVELFNIFSLRVGFIFKQYSITTNLIVNKFISALPLTVRFQQQAIINGLFLIVI